MCSSCQKNQSHSFLEIVLLLCVLVSWLSACMDGVRGGRLIHRSQGKYGRIPFLQLKRML